MWMCRGDRGEEKRGITTEARRHRGARRRQEFLNTEEDGGEKRGSRRKSRGIGRGEMRASMTEAEGSVFVCFWGRQREEKNHHRDTKTRRGTAKRRTVEEWMGGVVGDLSRALGRVNDAACDDIFKKRLRPTSSGSNSNSVFLRVQRLFSVLLCVPPCSIRIFTRASANTRRSVCFVSSRGIRRGTARGCCRWRWRG